MTAEAVSYISSNAPPIGGLLAMTAEAVSYIWSKAPPIGELSAMTAFSR